MSNENKFKAASETARGNGNWQGQNWIRPERRLACYLRDGLACAYCGDSVENGVKLTLDHIIPHSKGGTNAVENLATCCHKCNSARGNRSMESFAEKTAGYLDHGLTGAEIVAHIRDCVSRPLPLDEAKRLIASRGTAAKVVASFHK
jgi:hypothetical protein